jgi:hypothetical protein
MKEFLDGKAIRFYNRTGQRDAMAAFLRQCEGYGLRWADGSKASKMPYVGFAEGEYVAFIWIEPSTGHLIYRYEAPKAGYKDLLEVQPLRHTFGQFIRGDFWLHVRRDEIGEFLEMATRNKLLWAGGLPPRAGLKNRKVAQPGLTIAALYGSTTMAIIGEHFHGTPKKIVDFHYIPRSYEVPRSTTLDAVKAIERAERRGRAAIGQSILITANEGSNTTYARWARSEADQEQTDITFARCSPDDEYSFATGATVAIARLLGREAWDKAVAEANGALQRDSEAKKCKEIVVDNRKLSELSRDEIREVVAQIVRTAQAKRGLRA